MSSPAIFAIFLRVPKSGISAVPLAVMIDARPSFRRGCRTSSQYFISSVLLPMVLICTIRSSEI